jgi:hypothetical protein
LSVLFSSGPGEFDAALALFPRKLPQPAAIGTTIIIIAIAGASTRRRALRIGVPSCPPAGWYRVYRVNGSVMDLPPQFPLLAS